MAVVDRDGVVCLEGGVALAGVMEKAEDMVDSEVAVEDLEVAVMEDLEVAVVEDLEVVVVDLEVAVEVDLEVVMEEDLVVDSGVVAVVDSGVVAVVGQIVVVDPVADEVSEVDEDRAELCDHTQLSAASCLVVW